MTNAHFSLRTILWVCLFSIAFAFVEASVVVYLRAIYYPEGFEFPLRLMTNSHLWVELTREAATIVMLGAAGYLSGRQAWERFGYFLLAFGVWDLFYYVWLRVTLCWPTSLTDWDVLFLLPLPWIGPVIAPVLISLVMMICGVTIIIRLARGLFFHPPSISWILASVATLILLYSFMRDIPATLHREMPKPYEYPFLIVVLLLYGSAMFVACRRPVPRLEP